MWVYCAPSLTNGPGVEAQIATEKHTGNKIQIDIESFSTNIHMLAFHLMFIAQADNPDHKIENDLRAIPKVGQEEANTTNWTNVTVVDNRMLRSCCCRCLTYQVRVQNLSEMTYRLLSVYFPVL